MTLGLCLFPRVPGKNSHLLKSRYDVCCCQMFFADRGSPVLGSS